MERGISLPSRSSPLRWAIVVVLSWGKLKSIRPETYGEIAGVGSVCLPVEAYNVFQATYQVKPWKTTWLVQIKVIHTWKPSNTSLVRLWKSYLQTKRRAISSRWMRIGRP
ncbi:hypothetical protein Bca4012_038078 [Brassica carinata]